MQHKLKTRTGRAAYALRKQTVEPVFGIIKSVMGFRQFSLPPAARISVAFSFNLMGAERESNRDAVRIRT